LNAETTALNPTITHKPWLRLVLAWFAALLAGVCFIAIFVTAGGYAIQGFMGAQRDPVTDRFFLLLLLVESVILVFITLVTARLLGYCRVQLWRWGLAGFGSLLVWFGIWYFSSLGIANLSHGLTRSVMLAAYIHALPFATAAAGMLVVSWLGASSTLWRYWKGLLLGLAVGILLATINGFADWKMSNSGSFTLHAFWTALPFVWTSAVLFIERAAGRVDRNAYLVWLGLTLVMFVLSIAIVRSVKFW
jgi:hypothetical protein